MARLQHLPDDGPDKQCSKCDQVKHRSDFYVKDPKNGRLFAWCKACHGKKQTKVKPKIIKDEPRICKSCGETKVYEQFREDRWLCKSCEYERDRVTSAKAQITFRKKHRKRLAQRNLEIYRANAESIKVKRRLETKLNPERFAGYRRKWRKTKPDAPLIARLQAHRRRTLKRNVEGKFTLEEWNELKAKYDYTCLWCRKREPEIVLSPDHIIALSREGATGWISNIQPLCCTVGTRRGGCQYRKHNRNFDFRPYWPESPPEHPEFW